METLFRLLHEERKTSLAFHKERLGPQSFCWTTSIRRYVWEFYDEEGKLMRTMNFREVKNFDERRIPSVMELVPRDEKGKTVIRYLEAEFDIDIPEATFTTRNLRTFRG